MEKLGRENGPTGVVVLGGGGRVKDAGATGLGGSNGGKEKTLEDWLDEEESEEGSTEEESGSDEEETDDEEEEEEESEADEGERVRLVS